MALNKKQYDRDIQRQEIIYFFNETLYGMA
jgi:hypothetical protein